MSFVELKIKRGVFYSANKGLMFLPIGIVLVRRYPGVNAAFF